MGEDRPADGVLSADAEDLGRRLDERATALRRQISDARQREEELQADCLLDAADAGSAAEVLAAHLMETDRARMLLTRVEEALDRLENGGYGYCLYCGEAIDGERLRAFPHLELCMRCETRKKKRAG
jgi:DnaK suppressor protein